MNNEFLELVQLHERAWGNEQYPERPSMTQLLSTRIVAMWAAKAELLPDPKNLGGLKRTLTNEDRAFTFTIHESPDSLNEMLANICILGKPTRHANRRLVKVFIDQRDMEIVGVRLALKKDGV